MSEPSERIRAALFSRTTPARAPQASTSEADNDTNKLPIVAISDENLEALLGAGNPKDPKLAPSAELLLPVLAARDEERLRYSGAVEPATGPLARAAVGEALSLDAGVVGMQSSGIEPLDIAPAAAEHAGVESMIKAPTIESRGYGEEPVLETVEEFMNETFAVATEETDVDVAGETVHSVESASGATADERDIASLLTEPSEQVTGNQRFPNNQAPLPPTHLINSALFTRNSEPRTAQEIASRESRAQFIRWIAPGIILLLIAGGMTVYLLMARQPKPTASAAASSVPAAKFPLRLDVEMQANGQVSVRWNPAEAAVAQARNGRLVVIEQDQPVRTVALTRDQLGIGHISYQPSTERIEFRLEVVDQAGGVTQESVLALTPKAAAAASVLSANAAGFPNSANRTALPVANVTTQAGAQTSAARLAAPFPPIASPPAATPVATASPFTAPAPAKPAVAAPVAPAPIPSAEETPRARTAPRAFAPPASSKPSEEVRTVILEPPTIATGGTALPAGVGIPEGISNLAPPTAGAPAPRQIRVGGNIQSGLLVRRVTPEYPAVAKSARIQGVVRFSATIGKDGRIQDLQAIGGPSLLIPPAFEAVKQWIYRPTLLNGQAVEVVTQIEVNFTLGQ